MGLLDGLIVLGVFAGFGLLIWSKLVRRNSPVIQKIKDWFTSKKIMERTIKDKDQWYPPSIERKIN